MDRAILQAKEKGYVETIFGRKRYLSDINSQNSVVRGYAARAAASPARFAHIDAAQTRDQVWQQVWATCVQRGLLKPPTAAERA